MPKFTLIKHPEHETDAKVKVTFSTEFYPNCREFFDDFMKASGFEVPDPEANTDDFISPINNDDWLWNDAFDSKFRNDGPTGGEGADVIQFPISDS